MRTLKMRASEAHTVWNGAQLLNSEKPLFIQSSFFCLLDPRFEPTHEGSPEIADSDDCEQSEAAQFPASSDHTDRSRPPLGTMGPDQRFCPICDQAVIMASRRWHEKSRLCSLRKKVGLVELRRTASQRGVSSWLGPWSACS
jgi:hypothetical protein